GGGDGFVGTRVVVSRAEEPRFELARRQGDALVEHGGEKGGERLDVAGGGGGVVLDRALAEKDGEHRAHAVDRHLNAEAFGGSLQSLGETGGGAFKLGVRFAVA